MKTEFYLGSPGHQPMGFLNSKSPLVVEQIPSSYVGQYKLRGLSLQIMLVSLNKKDYLFRSRKPDTLYYHFKTTCDNSVRSYVQYSASKWIVQRRNNLFTDGQQKIALSEQREHSCQRWAERHSPHGLMEELVTDHITALRVCYSQQECLLNGMICFLYVSSPCPPALFKTNKNNNNKTTETKNNNRTKQKQAKKKNPPRAHRSNMLELSNISASRLWPRIVCPLDTAKVTQLLAKNINITKSSVHMSK